MSPKFLNSLPKPPMALIGITLLASTLAITGKAGAEPTSAERLAAIKDRFKPLPGDLALLSPEEVRDGGTRRPLQVRGFIQVNPKPRECLTIRRNVTTADQRICGPESLPFRATDLANDGSLNWGVMTAADLEPVNVSWPTPYRVGKRMASGYRSPAAIRPFVLNTCRVVADKRGPIMRLGLVSGEEWTIHFPKDDTFVNQAPELPELYIMGKESGPAGDITDDIIEGRRKEDIIEADRIEEREAVEMAKKQQPQEGELERPAPTPKPKVEKTPAQESASEHQSTKEKKPKEKPIRPSSKRYQVYEYRGRWAIPQRGSFALNAGSFKTLNESGDTRGTCRYQLKGAPKDASSGWIECHNVGLDEFIFLHLPCADELATVRKKLSTEQPVKSGQEGGKH